VIIIRNLQRKVKIDKEHIQRCLEIVLKKLKLEKTEIGILFVNDFRSKELNRAYRGKDSPTDVISFPMFHSIKEIKKTVKDSPYEEDLPIGDVVINLHQAERQAIEYDVELHEEVLRLIVHGVLHLCGYDHEVSKKQEKRMFTKQKELLDAIKKVG